MHAYTTEGLLPPACCFDPKWHDLARQLVYDHTPRYIGHVSQLPEDGTYALADDGEGGRLVLTREQGVIRCFDVRCRHQGAVLVDPSVTPDYTSPAQYGTVESLPKDARAGKKKCLVCPIHQWTYHLDGSLRGAPNFDLDRLPEDRKRLHEVPIRIWNGMIFSNIRRDAALPWEEEVAGYAHGNLFDLTEYFQGGEAVHEYGCSMHVFNKVYFDDRHVPLGHKTSFGAVMDLSVLRFVEGGHFNVQEVGFVMKPTTRLCPEYQAWHGWVLDLEKGVQPQFGALWTFFYPNFMIEWYPWTVVVSIMEPIAVDRSVNRCYFFYPNALKAMVDRGELSAAGLEAFMRVQQSAYGRTAVEDEDFVMRIAKGLRIAYERGEEFVGVPHPIEEKGIFSYDRYFTEVERAYRQAGYGE